MRNNRIDPEKIRTLSPEVSVLYRPEREWTYSHHAAIAWFNGSFYAMWSNGRVNEDDVGQRVLFSVSPDGVRWSEPAPLFDSPADGGTLSAGGWYARGDALNAYAGYYRYEGATSPTDERPRGDERHTGTTLLCKTTRDGLRWSDPVDLHLPITPNQGPRALSSGRLLMCGSFTFPYTDDPTGLSGWRIAGLPPCPAPGLQDDSEGFWIHQKLRGDEWPVCEGSFFEHGGRIVMLLRNARGNQLLCSESRDGGESWSAPQPTEIEDNNSKFFCMTLSDGRVALISNPNRTGRRCPLAVCLSEDGVNFSDRALIATEPIPMRVAGMYKGGVYGYPNALEKDGVLYVICSVNKEDIYLFRVPVAEL